MKQMSTMFTQLKETTAEEFIRKNLHAYYTASIPSQFLENTLL